MDGRVEERLQTAQAPPCASKAVMRGIWLVEALRDPETTKKPPTEGTERPPSSLRAVRQRRQGGQITHDTHSGMDLQRNREAEETETAVPARHVQCCARLKSCDSYATVQFITYQEIIQRDDWL